MPLLPLNGPSYEGFSVDVNAQKTVNWYVEHDPTGLGEVVLYPTPGSTFEDTVGGGPIRGELDLLGILYVLSGNSLYSWDTFGNSTFLGLLSTSVGRVSMATNGFQILIVDGVKGYIYNVNTAVFEEITDLDFPNGANSCCFIDSYFIVNDPFNLNTLGLSGAFFKSASYDGLTWSALDFVVTERDSDQVLAVANSNGFLWVIGERTTEIYYNSGNIDFPFERVNQAVVDTGCIAGQTVANVGNSLVWLSRNKYGNGQIVITNGYQVVPLSNSFMDQEIASYATTDDAFAFCMQWKGHNWYVLTFPRENKTWVYDFSSASFFQWSYDGEDNRILWDAYAYFNNKHVLGSSLDGKMYELTDTAYTDAGVLIHRIRQSPHISLNGKIGFCGALELVFESGVGNSGYPSPQVMVQWSKDRGHTWGSEQWRRIGDIGQYSLPSVWRRIGRFQYLTFKIKVTDAIKPILIRAHAMIDVGEQDVT